ncbi:MAG: hypothetical protein WDZ41_00040 [Candidatus Babeliales bacterium]
MSQIINAVHILPGPRNLIIPLDWHVERLDFQQKYNQFGPITQTLITALKSAKNPILVSTATWNNFVKRRVIFTDFINKPLPKLIENYKSEFPSENFLKKFHSLCNQFIQKKKVPEEINEFAVCWALQFNSNEWIIKKISDYFLLLIPKNYINELKDHHSQKLKDIEKAKELLNSTERERFEKELKELECTVNIPFEDIFLGLKYSNQETVQDPFDYKKFNINVKIDFEKEFFFLLSKIFVTKNDLGNNPQQIIQCLNEWYLYLNGHGSDEIIAGLSINGFKQLLKFWNNSIKTKLFYYDTCKIGGPHLKLPYEQPYTYPLKADKSLPLRVEHPIALNYAVIASSLLYSVITSKLINLEYDESTQRFIISKTDQNFDDFFLLSHAFMDPFSNKKELPSLSNLVLSVHPHENLALPYVQIPVIRFPGTEWFSVIEFDKKIFRLTRVLVEAAQAEDREIIIKNKAFIIIQPENFLSSLQEFTRGEILTSLKIIDDEPGDDKLFPIIVPNITKRSYFYFSQIDATEFDFYQIIDGFIPAEWEFKIQVRHFIRKLICRNPFEIGGDPVELHNVIISYYDTPDEHKIYFGMLDKIFYVKFLANEFFDENKIIPLPPNIVLPLYPFPLKPSKYRGVVEIIKKKGEQIKKKEEELEKQKKQQRKKYATMYRYKKI